MHSHYQDHPDPYCCYLVNVMVTPFAGKKHDSAVHTAAARSDPAIMQIGLGGKGKEEPCAEPTKGSPGDRLQLLSFHPPLLPDSTCVISATPFGGKVEMMLRLAGHRV